MNTKQNLKESTEQALTIPVVNGSYFEQMEKLQKELKEAEIKYVWGKGIHEQNRANLDMMIIINKIQKLKGID